MANIYNNIPNSTILELLRYHNIIPSSPIICLQLKGYSVLEDNYLLKQKIHITLNYRLIKLKVLLILLTLLTTLGQITQTLYTLVRNLKNNDLINNDIVYIDIDPTLITTDNGGIKRSAFNSTTSNVVGTHQLN